MAPREIASRLRRSWLSVRQGRFDARLRRRGTAGPGCHIARGTRIAARVNFGRGTRVNGPGIFKGHGQITFGNYCALGDGVRMISSNHRTDHLNLQAALHSRIGAESSWAEVRGPIEIGHNVWIGDAAIVLSGVTIGDGAVIGAGSVVTKDVSAFAVVAGVPARFIRMRFSAEEVERQQKLAWWDWSEEQMRENAHLFAESLPTS